MLREYVILLCAVSFVCGIVADTGAQNAAANSQGPISGADKKEDLLASPSQFAYQKIEASRTNQHELPLLYQVNSAVVDKVSEDTSARSVPVHGSPNVQLQTVATSVSTASDPSSLGYTNILERYAPSVQPVQPYFAVPVAARTVSIGPQYAVNVGQDTQATDDYITKHFVVYNNDPAQSGHYIVVSPAKTVIEQQRAVNILPPSSPGIQYSVPDVPLSINSDPRPFHPASTATFESHGKFIVQSPNVASYQVNQVNQVNQVQPANQYLPPAKIAYDVKPAVKTVSVPVPVARKVTIEAHDSTQTHPPSAHVASYQVNQINQVQPANQYLPPAKIAYNVKPAVKTVSVPVPVAKKVTIEAHNSIQTHPPPAPKYAPVSIPVPVIYQPLETNTPEEQQQQLVVPTPSSYVQAPVGLHPIPVPVYPVGGGLQYHSLPVASRRQQEYTKVVHFSPASEVSHVTFNGLGVSYGW